MGKGEKSIKRQETAAAWRRRHRGAANVETRYVAVKTRRAPLTRARGSGAWRYLAGKAPVNWRCALLKSAASPQKRKHEGRGNRMPAQKKKLPQTTGRQAAVNAARQSGREEGGALEIYLSIMKRAWA